MDHAVSILNSRQPPTRQQTDADPARTLSWIQDRLTALYISSLKRDSSDRPLLDRIAYLSLYTAVHDFSAAVLQRQQNKRIYDFSCRDLYTTLERLIRSHCIAIRGEVLASASASGDSDRGVLEAYHAHWTTFNQLAGFAARVMGYFERHWVLRVRDEQKGKQGTKEEVFLLRELHSIVWTEELSRGGEIVEAARRLEKREGGEDGEVVAEFGKVLEGLGVRGGLLAAIDDEMETQ